MAYTFVLVHGAWHGGWCWQRVADRLRGGGHEVLTPTLTGMGEHSHMLPPGSTWRPTCRHRQCAEVGSCGTWCCAAIPTAALLSPASPKQMASAIRSIVFLDAFVPRQRRKGADLTGPAVQEAVRARCSVANSRSRRGPAEAFGVNAADRAWVDRLCVGQPIGTFTDKIVLTGARERIARKSYIRAKSYANPGFDRASRS